MAKTTPSFFLPKSLTKVGNLDKSRIKEVTALADTGATLTVLPQSLAEELGIKAVGLMCKS